MVCILVSFRGNFWGRILTYKYVADTALYMAVVFFMKSGGYKVLRVLIM